MRDQGRDDAAALVDRVGAVGAVEKTRAAPRVRFVEPGPDRRQQRGRILAVGQLRAGHAPAAGVLEHQQCAARAEQFGHFLDQRFVQGGFRRLPIEPQAGPDQPLDTLAEFARAAQVGAVARRRQPALARRLHPARQQFRVRGRGVQVTAPQPFVAHRFDRTQQALVSLAGHRNGIRVASAGAQRATVLPQHVRVGLRPAAEAAAAPAHQRRRAFTQRQCPLRVAGAQFRPRRHRQHQRLAPFAVAQAAHQGPPQRHGGPGVDPALAARGRVLNPGGELRARRQLGRLTRRLQAHQCFLKSRAVADARLQCANDQQRVERRLRREAGAAQIERAPHQPQRVVPKPEPVVGETQVVQRARLLLPVAGLDGELQRRFQAAQALRQVGVTGVERVDRPALGALVAGGARQRDCTLTECTVGRRVGLQQAYAAQHAQGLTL